MGGDSGVVDTGTSPDSGTVADGATLGCANGGGPCPAGEMCCSGIPYPPAGLCSGTCGAVSDRNLKQGFAAVDRDETLLRLARLPVTSWSYRAEPGVRHVGPMAQDFRAAFGLGPDDRTIQFVDAKRGNDRRGASLITPRGNAGAHQRSAASKPVEAACSRLSLLHDWQISLLPSSPASWRSSRPSSPSSLVSQPPTAR